MSEKYFPKEAAQFAALLETFAGKKVAVIGHLRPDGDCIGSQVAVCRMLRARGCDATCVNGHAIPANLRAFVGDTPYIENGDFTRDGHEGFFTDCSDAGRAGPELAKMFPDAAANLDHHMSNPLFARENIVLPTAAAACFMIAAFALDAGIEFDATTAQALYVGIVTDTGQFQYPATTSDVLAVAAELLRRGASVRATTDAIYEHDTFARLALLQRFLKSLTLYENGRVCAGTITQADLTETQTTREDLEEFVNYARRIDGVDIAVLIEELNGSVKGSIRAKDERYRADLLAQKLNGGGHVLAAGFRLSNTPFVEGKNHILNTIRQHLQTT
jgi:phosphoesterase RecJ-like protein